MENDIWFVIIMIVFLLAVLGGIVLFLIMAIKNAPRQMKEAEEQIARRAQMLSEESPAMEHVTASVVDLNCQVNMVGTQTPKTVKVFTVVFQPDNREMLTFEIPEEMYTGLEVGQRGMLTYVDHSLYGFELED